jgi:hypothetical protein
VVVALAATGLALGLSGHSSPGASNLGPQQRLETANDNRAAEWVAQQVSPGTVIFCDKQTCAALEAHRVPASDLRLVGPSSGNLQGPGLIIATATVRALFGTSLGSADAPVVLTTFGSSETAVQIRVVPAGSWTAYQQQLRADLANRQKIARELLNSNHIATSPQAHAQMAAGDPDIRVLFAIAALAGSAPVYIVDFGNVATAESSNVPLRYVDLALRDKVSHASGPAYLGTLLSQLNQLQGTWRPMRTQKLTLSGDGAVLRILFGAPSPLGLLSPSGG